MSHLNPERFDRLQKSLIYILDCKQANGDSEEVLLLWLDRIAHLWEGTVQAELFIDDLKFSITESRYVITKIREM